MGCCHSNTAVQQTQSAAPNKAALRKLSRLPKIVTNAISKDASPGDLGTNRRYHDLMVLVEQMLDRKPTSALSWEHRGEDARQATDEELMREGTHSEEYLDAMRGRTAEAVEDGGLLTDAPSAGWTSLTEKAARCAAAALIDAAADVLDDRAPCAFVLARPPSHHAVGNADRARGNSPENLPFGFCHINSISAAVASVRHTLGPDSRVAILDVDVHPGNGNEDTWYSSPHVLHVNLSQEGIWPGTQHGDPKHVGDEEGVGYNRNFPIEAEQGDDAYVYTLHHHVFSILEDFSPSMIFVAAGFDALEGDPYANMELTPHWFGWLAAELRDRNIAPVVYNLEGGYNPRNVCDGINRVLDAMCGTSAETFLEDMGLSVDADDVCPDEDVKEAIDNVAALQLSTIAGCCH